MVLSTKIGISNFKQDLLSKKKNFKQDLENIEIENF